jgi:MFS family permease
LKIPRAVFCIVSMTFSMIFSVFMLGYLSQFLTETDSLMIKKESIGYIISMWAFFYTLAAFLAGKLSKKFG